MREALKPGDLDSLVLNLPKTDLHVHLDGSLRLDTLIELAKEGGVDLPTFTADGLREKVFTTHYGSLSDYLEGFRYTVAVLKTAEALERVAYELCEDCWNEGVSYVEIRFAPQLHVRKGLTLDDVVRAVARGIARAERNFNQTEEVREGRFPPFRGAIIFCALRMFQPEFSDGYSWYFQVCGHPPDEEVFVRASLDLARSALHFREDQGIPVTGFDLAGQEKGYPAEDHRQAFQIIHGGFLGKTVHAGEDFGPESIFQAIGELHADRIGHGTWLFDASRVTDPKVTDREEYIERLAQFVADRRITIEVCLSSNQQTVPELRGDLGLHPFPEMVKRKISTAICTDNRLISDTTVTREVMLATETFSLSVKNLRDILTHGFKRSFFPGPYLEKRDYVRKVLDISARIINDWETEET